MNARLPYLFALALTLPLASCRFVGQKPDFGVLGDALTPAVTDAAYVETQPTASVAIASPALPAAAPAPAMTSVAPAPVAAAPLPPPEELRSTRRNIFTKAYWKELFSPGSAREFFTSAQQIASYPEEKHQTPPPPRRVTTAAPAPAPTTRSNNSYTVQPGDTLARIARLHQIPLSSLAAANGIDLQKATIHPGQKLRLPAANSPAPRPSAPAAPRATSGSYRVCAGDTLLRIARQHGITLRELLQANNLDKDSARRVRVGTILTIPTQKQR